MGNLHLRDLRKSRGFTQGYVADKLNVTTMCYNNWETGKWSVSLSYIKDMAEVFDLSPPAMFMILAGSVPKTDIFGYIKMGEQSLSIDEYAAYSIINNDKRSDDWLEEFWNLSRD